VNIRYSTAYGRFEAEFSQDFQGDLAAVKAAGFKPDTSTGAWVWHTAKIPVLQKLRENKPASGLTITPDGLEVFKKLEETHNRNTLIKAEAAKIAKAQKKERKDKEQEDETAKFLVIPDGKIWIDKEDLPPAPPYESSFVRPPSPSLRCITCNDPVYKEFELSDPPICLYCEKTLFDPHKKLDKPPAVL